MCSQISLDVPVHNGLKTQHIKSITRTRNFFLAGISHNNCGATEQQDSPQQQ